MNGDSTLASFHATVQGRVQGVFFRAFEWELGDVRDIWTFFLIFEFGFNYS